MSDECWTIKQFFTDYVKADGDRRIDISQLKRLLQNVSQTQLFDILWGFEEESPNGAAATLHCAARKGDINLIRCIVAHIQSTERCTDLLLSEWYGRTVVHYAAKHGNLDTLKYIIQSLPMGSRADALKQPTATIQQTTIQLGVESSHTTCTKSVVCRGDTVIHYAAMNGHVDIFKYVLSHFSGDIVCEALKQKTTEGETAMHYAAMNDNVGIFDHILNRLPSRKVTDMLKQETVTGETVAYYIEKYHNPHVLEFVRNKIPAEEADELFKKGDSVMCAAEQGHMDSVQSPLGYSSSDQQPVSSQLTSNDGKTTEQLMSTAGRADIVSLLQKRIEAFMTPGLSKPNAIKPPPGAMPQAFPQNYITRGEPESHEDKEFYKQIENPCDVSQSQKLRGIPPNIIAKIEQQDSFKRQVSVKIIEFKEKEAEVTGQLKEMEQELAVSKREKEDAVDQRDEWKFQCNKLENELHLYKKDLKAKDSVISELTSAVANLSSTTKTDADTNKDLADENRRLRELLSDKQKIESERDKTIKEFEKAKSQLQRCEDGLQEPEGKEQAIEQKWKDLRQELERYKQAVRELGKQVEMINYQKDKLLMEGAKAPVRSKQELLPPITTVAQQPEASGEQTVDQYSDDDEIGIENELRDNEERFTREFQTICAVADTEKQGDEKITNPMSVDNIHIQQKEKEREINTTYEGGIDELLSNKQKIENEQDQTRKALENAKSVLQRYEDRLQELEGKEQTTKQEWEDLRQELERYNQAVRELEKKDETINYQNKKLLMEGAKEPVRSKQELLPPITTVAQESVAAGELARDQYYTEKEGDEKATNAMSVDNIHIQEKEKEREINTTYEGGIDGGMTGGLFEAIDSTAGDCCLI